MSKRKSNQMTHLHSRERAERNVLDFLDFEARKVYEPYVSETSVIRDFVDQTLMKYAGSTECDQTVREQLENMVIEMLELRERDTSKALEILKHNTTFKRNLIELQENIKNEVQDSPKSHDVSLWLEEFWMVFTRLARLPLSIFTTRSFPRSEGLVKHLTFWIPRKHRQDIRADLLDDCEELREFGSSEWRIRLHVLWQ